VLNIAKRLRVNHTNGKFSGEFLLVDEAYGTPVMAAAA